jgi:TM2 domain-containing membrane protein YozV
MFCPSCGNENADTANICVHCGRAMIIAPSNAVAPGAYEVDATVYSDFVGKKIVAGVCAILLGSLGIHKFILGLTTPGVIMLLITVLTCGAGSIVTGTIGIIEGIVYLTKSDQEFYQRYAVEKKGWF